MSTKLRYASGLALAVTFLTTLTSAEGSGAVAQSYEPAPLQQPAPEVISEPVPQPLPAAPAEEELAAEDDALETIDADTLHELVAAVDVPAELSREMQCLAGAIYFEAKSESLEGQLAVGRVIVARSRSGRFPASYCGVVYQRSQFSFVRGQSMPAINKSSRQWANAVKIARIADAGSWKSPAEGALFFHAAHVSPGWRLKRVARVENHVFYR